MDVNVNRAVGRSPALYSESFGLFEGVERTRDDKSVRDGNACLPSGGFIPLIVNRQSMHGRL